MNPRFLIRHDWAVEVPFAKMEEEQVWGGNQAFSYEEDEEPMLAHVIL